MAKVMIAYIYSGEEYLKTVGVNFGTYQNYRQQLHCAVGTTTKPVSMFIPDLNIWVS